MSLFNIPVNPVVRNSCKTLTKLLTIINIIAPERRIMKILEMANAATN
jgi:hypothetical protein